ncbi:hypothetical protein NO1_1498 [Candidatus Termititenax aidoneus]|uniref:PorV/PorQ family protein n=1 Tax=Termititenax aidoneus TaxID=2218524 RepID=A0A388TBV7_TERA1|nr:hypothetical protein NO1_1498 [Candidatus Termititenax aidoneus]
MCITAALWADDKETFNTESLLIGADAMARGGSYIAGAGSSPLFQNFAVSTAPKFSFTAFTLMSALNYLSAAYAQNGFALGVLTLQDSAGYNRDENNNLTGGQINYSDSTIYGSYGLALGSLNLGLRLKYVSRSLSEIASARGYALDFSGLYTLNDHWSFGLAAANISQSSLLWADGRAEMFPVNTILGVKYSIFGREDKLNLFADLRLEYNDFFNCLGLEWKPLPLFALRGGLTQVSAWQEDREIKLFQPAAGLGLNLFGFSFDYAFNPDADLADSVSHFFTLGYTFGSAAQPAAGSDDLSSEAEQSAAAAGAADTDTTLDTDTELMPNGRRRIYKDILHLPQEDQLIIEDLGYLDMYKPAEIDEPAADTDNTDK